MNIIQKTFDIGNGQMVTIESGKLARQADGSAVVKCGNTMLLATVCSKTEAGENVDFMPLSVDYQEKFAANGKIPGSFHRREMRPSDYEILICRLVDRALRPMFPEDFHADTQVQIFLISADPETQPDALACLAASAALAASDVPFNGPISEVRVARVHGEFLVNPTSSQILEADLDIIVAATKDNIVMVEGEANEAQEADLLAAIQVAHEAIKGHCAALEEFTILAGKSEKREYNHERHDDELRARIEAACYDKVYAVAKSGKGKKERSVDFKSVLNEFIESHSDEEKANLDMFLVKKYYHDVEYQAMRDMILNEKTRLDGRDTKTIRPIWSEIDYLPGAHGSAIFTRGETQSLTTVTLGAKKDEKLLDGALFDYHERFMLHYNFPGFSTGEVKPNRGQSRREIGHGNLAARAIRKVLPNTEECPYTVRIVSDILESNGSSSMATVCAGTLALMDAGVQIKAPVSGIAMGLIKEGDRAAVLSDILGDEDHLGDMDFKVTGTAEGITAVQMDIKIDGLPYDLLSSALQQAKEGRLHILGKMMETINTSRSDYKAHTPRIVALKVDAEFIGPIIGPGGKHIQELQRETNTTISIEDEGKFGLVQIYSIDQEGMEKAVARIKGITGRPEIGADYEGKVRSIQPYGAFVEFMPGKDGLLHVSEISYDRIDKVEDVLQEGQIIKVRLLEIDPKTGKYRLSAKVYLEKPEGYVERPATPRPPRPEGDRRDRGDRNDRGPRTRD